MKIINGMYNIPKVVIKEAITPGTPVVVGTKKDILRLADIIGESGAIIIEEATVGGEVIRGCMNAHHFYGGADEGIDFGGVSNKSGDQTVISGTLIIDGNDAKLTVNISILE